MSKNISYEAVNDNPRVFVAFGETPAKALKNMAKILKRNDIVWWNASSVDYIDDDELFYMTVYC